MAPSLLSFSPLFSSLIILSRLSLSLSFFFPLLLSALKNTLALQSHVIRDGAMTEVPAREVVPGDIIALRLGDLIPADAKLLGLNSTFEVTKTPLAIDESGLTGESLPVEKNKGEIVWSGCIVKQGVMLAIVTKTGSNTFVGRAAHLIATTDEQGHFQKVVQQIGNLLIAITLSAVILIVIVKSAQGKHYDLILDLILSITIAGKAML
jgi:H+-transporting ATPase